MREKRKEPNRQFDLEAGRRLAGKYRVEERIGDGWEGEVYRVTEEGTDIERAAKLFYPDRNPGGRAVRFYARKLEKLRSCSVLIRYCTRDTFRCRGEAITMLISEFAPGEVLPDFLKRQRGGRLAFFEALHLFYPLVRGLEEIHQAGEYHGDVHAGNVLVLRQGLGFQVRLIDFYNHGRRGAEHVHDDIAGAIRVFYDILGGAKHYPNLPPQAKAICRGLKTSLIRQRFPAAAHLRRHLETFSWE
jgi:tRNA A-37 threonylcarbamoyl transferase component Bud32